MLSHIYDLLKTECKYYHLGGVPHVWRNNGRETAKGLEAGMFSQDSEDSRETVSVDRIRNREDNLKLIKIPRCCS